MSGHVETTRSNLLLPCVSFVLPLLAMFESTYASLGCECAPRRAGLHTAALRQVGGMLEPLVYIRRGYAGGLRRQTLTDLVHEAVELTGKIDVPVEHKPVLLSDNGSGHISKPLNEYLDLM